MKKAIFILEILLLFSCGVQRKKPVKERDLNRAEYKLKIGPLNFSNEARIDIVHGVTVNNPAPDFLTELYFNFGGQINCENKSISAIFDFKKSKDLLVADGWNSPAPGMKKIIIRERDNSKVTYDFRNPSVLTMGVFETINLKPNGRINKIHLKLESQCGESLELPLTIVKYNVSGIEELIMRHIKDELNSLSVKELTNLKVIFSYNPIHLQNNSFLEVYDEKKMRILSFNRKTDEYVLKDLEENIIKRIKRST